MNFSSPSAYIGQSWCAKESYLEIDIPKHAEFFKIMYLFLWTAEAFEGTEEQQTRFCLGA